MIYTVITPQEEVKEVELPDNANDSIIELISRKKIYNTPPAHDKGASLVNTVKYRTLIWETLNFLIPEDWEIRIYSARIVLGMSLDPLRENIEVSRLYEKLNKRANEENAILIGAKNSYVEQTNQIEVRAIGYIKK